MCVDVSNSNFVCSSCGRVGGACVRACVRGMRGVVGGGGFFLRSQTSCSSDLEAKRICIKFTTFQCRCILK